MGLVLFALKSLVRRGRRNLLAIIILAFGLTIFFVGNALLDGSEAGLASVFRDALIGDAAIGYADSQPVSIWGYEELFSTQFTKIPVLNQAAEIGATIERNSAVASVSRLVASAALMEVNQFRSPIYLMGTESAKYFPSRKFHFLKGAPPHSDEHPWIIISGSQALVIKGLTGRSPEVGDTIQITYADADGFVIRGIPLAGIIDFPVENTAMNSLCLVDLPSAWDLLGLAKKNPVQSSLASASMDPNDLFADAPPDQEGAAPAGAKSWNSNDIKGLLQGDPITNQRASDGAVQFLLVQFKNPRSFDSFTRQFQDYGKANSARLMDWRSAAGQNLRYVVSIQQIFNGGMLLFSLLVILIFINTLSNSILERRSEIGVLRALGARRKKVSLVFTIEYVFIGLISLTAALLVGWLAVIAINAASFHLSNEILINLFGGTILKAQIGFALVVKGLLLSLALPLLVVLLMSARLAAITPQQAMQNGT